MNSIIDAIGEILDNAKKLVVAIGCVVSIIPIDLSTKIEIFVILALLLFIFSGDGNEAGDYLKGKILNTIGGVVLWSSLIIFIQTLF